MVTEFPAHLPRRAVEALVLSLADDELTLGHRDSEWTGHAPILEEDIAFSNIAQDELGHSLVWYTLYEELTGRSPDCLAFERRWNDFTNCHFVSYPKGDFAYTVVRQYLFDAAEQTRLKSFCTSSYQPIKDIAAKLIREEAYHVMHLQGLVERLGDATEESHRRMQAALDAAFPQALGIFEPIGEEQELVRAGVFPGNDVLQNQWMMKVVPLLAASTLSVPVESRDGTIKILCGTDYGGRRGTHIEHMKQLVDDLQYVYRMVPGAKW